MVRLIRQPWALALLASGVISSAAGVVLHSAASRAQAQVVGDSLTPAQLGRLQRLNGKFTFVSGTSRETLHSAITAATQARDARVARAARAQLEATLLPARRVQFELESTLATGAGLQMLEGGRRISTPVSGVSQSISSVQTGARLSQRLQGSTLVQVIENRGLRQERRFYLDATGATLTLDVRVTGDALSTPVQVQAVYQRL